MGSAMGAGGAGSEFDEIVEGKGFESGKTFKVRVDMNKLCNGNKEATVKFEVWDRHSNKKIGSFQTTVSMLETKQRTSRTLMTQQPHRGGW